MLVFVRATVVAVLIGGLMMFGCSDDSQHSTPAAPSSYASTTAATLTISPSGVGPLRLGMSETDALATGLLNLPTTTCVGIANYRQSTGNPPLAGGALFENGALVSVIVSRGTALADDGRLLGLTLDDLRARLGPQYVVALNGPGGAFDGILFTVEQNGHLVYDGLIDPPHSGTITDLGVPRLAICE